MTASYQIDTLPLDGPALKSARHRCGFTLSEVAELISYSASTISSVENGHDNPSRRLLRALSDLYAGPAGSKAKQP